MLPLSLEIITNRTAPKNTFYVEKPWTPGEADGLKAINARLVEADWRRGIQSTDFARLLPKLEDIGYRCVSTCVLETFILFDTEVTKPKSVHYILMHISVLSAIYNKTTQDPALA